MATFGQAKGSTEIKEKQEKKPYEPPAIIYEGIITTRAGSPASLLEESKEGGIDPADLFGNGG